MASKIFHDKLTTLLVNAFAPAGYILTKLVEVDVIPQNSAYDALSFALNNKNIVYRKAKQTPDRPGAFLTLWQRPLLTAHNTINKPVPLADTDLDYLFVKVELPSPSPVNQGRLDDGQYDNKPYGLFIFPVTLLIEKGIVDSNKRKGKTAFRVFTPWSQDRGRVGTKLLSNSAKKTQGWQLHYFINIDEQGFIDADKLHKLLK